MSKLMERLEKLTDFEKKLIECNTVMNSLQKNPETTLAQMQRAAELEQTVAKEFNEWMTHEFNFGPGPQIMPSVLKRVLETSIEPKPQIILT